MCDVSTAKVRTFWSRTEFAEPLNQFFSVHYFGEDLNFRKIKVLSVI